MEIAKSFSDEIRSWQMAINLENLSVANKKSNDVILANSTNAWTTKSRRLYGITC